MCSHLTLNMQVSNMAEDLLNVATLQVFRVVDRNTWEEFESTGGKEVVISNPDDARVWIKARDDRVDKTNHDA